MCVEVHDPQLLRTEIDVIVCTSTVLYMYVPVLLHVHTIIAIQFEGAEDRMMARNRWCSSTLYISVNS